MHPGAGSPHTRRRRPPRPSPLRGGGGGACWEPDLAAPAERFPINNVDTIAVPAPLPPGAPWSPSRCFSLGRRKRNLLYCPSSFGQGPAGAWGWGLRKLGRGGRGGRGRSAWGHPSCLGCPTHAQGKRRRVRGPGQASFQAPSQTPGSGWAGMRCFCGWKNQASKRGGSTPSSLPRIGMKQRGSEPLSLGTQLCLGTQPFRPPTYQRRSRSWGTRGTCGEKRRHRALKM